MQVMSKFQEHSFVYGQGVLTALSLKLNTANEPICYGLIFYKVVSLTQ